MAVNERHISLAAEGSTSIPLLVAGAVRFSVSVTQASTFTWSSGVIAVEWTVDPDADRWQAFNPARELNVSNQSYANIGVAGLLAVRLRTTTAQGSADPAAVYDWAMMMPDASTHQRVR